MAVDVDEAGHEHAPATAHPVLRIALEARSDIDEAALAERDVTVAQIDMACPGLVPRDHPRCLLDYGERHSVLKARRNSTPSTAAPSRQRSGRAREMPSGLPQLRGSSNLD